MLTDRWMDRGMPSDGKLITDTVHCSKAKSYLLTLPQFVADSPETPPPAPQTEPPADVISLPQNPPLFN